MQNPYEAPQAHHPKSSVDLNSLLKSPVVWLAVPAICLTLGIIATRQSWNNLFLNAGIATSIVCCLRALVVHNNTMLTIAIIFLALNGVLRSILEAILNIG